MFGAQLGEKDLIQGFISALLLLVIAAGASWFAQKRNYYQTPHSPPLQKGAISLIDVFGAFLIFIVFQLLIMPIFLILAVAAYRGTFSNVSSIGMNFTFQGWGNLASMVLTFLFIISYAWLIGKSKLIWNRQDKNIAGITWDILIGIITWLIAFPFVIGMSELITVGIVYYFGVAPVDQLAVKYMKTLVGNPVLFWSTGIVMATLIPATEEVLFRGFLQNWFVGRVGRVVGIGITAFIFALFHMSAAQGIHNLDLVVPLFILACYLGYIYERQQTLWAPIALHATFNSVSLAMLYFSKDAS